MQDESTSPTAPEPWTEEKTDAELIKLIGEDQTPWSVDEIATELPSAKRLTLLDSLGKLRSAGIVHRCDELWMITRAAHLTYDLTGAL